MLTAFSGTGLTIFWIKHLSSALVRLAQWFRWKPADSRERRLRACNCGISRNPPLSLRTDKDFGPSKTKAEIEQMENRNVSMRLLSLRIINHSRNKMPVSYADIGKHTELLKSWPPLKKKNNNLRNSLNDSEHRCYDKCSMAKTQNNVENLCKCFKMKSIHQTVFFPMWGK